MCIHINAGRACALGHGQGGGGMWLVVGAKMAPLSQTLLYVAICPYANCPLMNCTTVRSNCRVLSGYTN